MKNPEFRWSYVKIPYYRDHTPTLPFTLEKGTDYHVSRPFSASNRTTVLPKDATVVAVTVRGTD